ncbi:MAG: DUF5916 domain-containing protein [Balneolaceae bacterium]|nr:DUF5916 domain-containing protein [Balneolaceae bacterium]
MKVGLARNLTLDLTANPDFAQVEADDQQVNLTRFSLFFPEKRKFFQERASTFAFRFEGQDRLFYSRRIGLHDGEEVGILRRGAPRRRLGGWDLDCSTCRPPRAPGYPPKTWVYCGCGGG